MADGSPQQFTSWDQVAGQFGSVVSNQLQSQNVPLSQVGQLAQQFGSSLGQNIGSQTLGGSTMGFSGGGGNQQQPPAAPTTSTSILTDPQYNLQRIGAAVTGQPMVVNPNPSQQPINAKGGIYSGPQNPIISASTPQTSSLTGPESKVPGLVGGAAQVPRPTQITPNFMTGTQQPGGTNFQQPTPFAGVPAVRPPAAPAANVNTTPVQTQFGPSTPGINLPAPPPSFSTIARGGGAIGGAIPPVSAGSPPIGSLGVPQRFQHGGQVKSKSGKYPTITDTPGYREANALWNVNEARWLQWQLQVRNRIGELSDSPDYDTRMNATQAHFGLGRLQDTLDQLKTSGQKNPFDEKQTADLDGMRKDIDDSIGLIHEPFYPMPVTKSSPSDITPTPQDQQPEDQQPAQPSASATPVGKQTGGAIGNKNDTDIVPAMLTPGEYVINRQAAQNLGKEKLDKLNKSGKKKSGLGSGLGILGMADGGEIPAVTGSAQAYAYGQLTPEEQLLLQQAQSGGNMSPQVMALQKKLSGLVSQYIGGNPSSGTGAPPDSNSIAKSMFSGGYKPDYSATRNTPANLYSQGASGGGYETSAPGMGNYYVGASPSPGISGNIYPNQQAATAAGDVGAGSGGGAAGGLSQQQAGALAGGISGIGQAWANAAQQVANEKWTPIQAGSWANPNLYANQENAYYQRYHDQMQQLII